MVLACNSLGNRICITTYTNTFVEECSIEQVCAAEALPERASSLPLSGSSAQRKLPKNAPHPSLYRAAPCSRSPPKSLLFLPPIEQPHAVGAPPKSSLFFPHPSSPAQQELPQQLRLSSSNRAAPRSWRSIIKSLLLPPSVRQLHAAEAPQERASFLPLSSISSAQRELHHKEPPQQSYHSY